MATPPYCPSCFVKLEPDMRACPNCPMSFPEDDDLPKQSENPLKQSRYYQFVMPALFFAGLGGLIWWMATGLFRLGEENANTPQINVLGNAPATERTLAAGLASSTTYSGPKPPPPFEGSGTISIAPVVPAEEPPPPPVAAEPPPKPVKAVKEWKLRGTVYDLATLKPLSGVQLTFTDAESSRSIQTRSNSEGHYKALVPSLPDRGYAVTAEKNGYSPNYLDPSTEGVRSMSAAQRKELVGGLATTLSVTPAMLQGSAAPLVTDFFLAPRP